MYQASLLKVLYCQSSFNRTAPLRAVIETLFDGSYLEERLISSVLSSIATAPGTATQNAVLQHWRDFLTLILVMRANDNIGPHLPQLLKSMRKLQAASLWPEHQLLTMHETLAALLLGKSIKDYSLFQLPNGACPLEVDGYTQIGQIPHPLFHAELGTLLCLYSDLTEEPRYAEAALKLAEWQRNTLDHNYHPFVGLLSKEGEASESELLVGDFLLFNAVARTSQYSEMAFLAEKQCELLDRLANSESIDIPSLSIVLEHYFAGKKLPDVSGEYYLPSVFQDELFALAGSRSAESSAAATLYGGKSGMGCYHYKDIKVINFGPQNTPLGDCRGFGLEGGIPAFSEFKTELSTATGEFVLDGTARLCPQNPQASSENSSHGGWMEIRQEFKNGLFSIETSSQDLFDKKEILFSFFVKCKNCVVDGDRIVRPRSLNRYVGKAASVQFQSGESSLFLQVKQPHDEMHVIPLGGGSNFWGADFLVAYVLNTNKCVFSLSSFFDTRYDSL